MWDNKPVIDPKYLPTRPPFWPSVILWLICDRFDYNPWLTSACVAVAVLAWIGTLILLGCQKFTHPSRLT